MKNRPVLSIAPYYGGKGHMAHFIADRLNYDDSDIFVTPFGGMCRVLLNKTRHKLEIYNDYSSGLNALMTVLSAPQTADKFIHRLYEETEFSKEEFNRQKIIYDNAENDLEVQEKEKLRRLIIDNDICNAINARAVLDEILWQGIEIAKRNENPERNKLVHEVSETVQNAMNTLREKLRESEKENSPFVNEFQTLFQNWAELYALKESQGFLGRPADMGEYVSDMDLAIATYVVFKMSRDGMGTTFSEEKFKTTDQYQQHVLKLYECAERLENVYIYQIDAVDFFRRRQFVDVDTPIDTVPPQFRIMNEWVRNPKVMMYCDPSYISPNDEAKLLKGIDIYNTDCLYDAVKEKYKGKMPKNLGKIYARSFGYEEQEKFLRCIQNANCKIMVSNSGLLKAPRMA